MTLSVENLEFKYGRDPVLRGVTVEARPGRITALIGPNAAGKSTLLRCLTGSLRPSRGQVLIDGQISHRASARWLAGRMAYVPQRAVVAAAFTTQQVIELGRYALPPAPHAVLEVMGELELLSIADRPFTRISVGQQQRVILARSLVQLADDGHLALDEPTSAMDLKHAHAAVTALRRRAARGATIILALHDLGVAADIADDVWLLHEGRLVAAGTTRVVMTPVHLARVFGVSFTMVNDAAGRARLFSNPAESTPTTIPLP